MNSPHYSRFRFHACYFGCSLALIVAASSIAPPTASVPGHVEAWGYDVFGQTTPPDGLDDVVAIAAGGSHSLALRSNGTVVAWGNNLVGQTETPAGLSNVTAISAAGHNVALKADGTVFVWGWNSPAVTNVPATVTNVLAIAAGNLAGNSYTIALRSNGTVIAWGLPNSATNVPLGLTGVVGIAAGNSHALALKNDGSIVGWGENNVGQATPPPGLTGVLAVRAGQSTSFAIKSDGMVVGWGQAVVPTGLTGVVDLQDGASHTLALRTNGEVVAWGFNASGQGSVPAGLSGVTAISAGGNHNLVITPRPLILSISPPITANVGDTITFSVAATGQPLSYQWQHNGANLIAQTNSSLTLTNVQPANAGNYQVLVRNPYGSVLSGPTSLAFPPPTITMNQPDLTRYRGEEAVFRITAEGLQPLRYQWRKDGVELAGATAATLTIASVRFTNEGVYDVVVTDAAGGSTASANAVLTVIDPTISKALALGPAADTSIFSPGGNKPHGVLTILAGRRGGQSGGILDRALLRFDLASVPVAAVIQSVRLRLTVSRIPPIPPNAEFSIHRMLRHWSLDATWANATAGAPWAAPGAASGTDYAALRGAAQFVPGGGAYEFGPTPQVMADLAAWIANPATNHGWLLKAEDESPLSSARHFGSSESAQPPQLLIDYSTPAPPPRLTGASLQGDNFSFRFAGEAGWIYRVESSADLAGPWTIVTNAPAGAATNPILIAFPYNPPNRFFRVIAE